MGKSIILIILGLIIFVLGWTSALIFKNLALYNLSWEISATEIVSIIVDVVLAVLIGYILTQKMGNRRVEKDYYIGELSAINEIINELEKIYSHNDRLSMIEINYAIGKSRKNFNNLWNNLKLDFSGYTNTHKKSYEKVLNAIKTLNMQLTDSKYYKGSENYIPLMISKNKVILNKTIRPIIDASFIEIRDSIFKMKLEINRL